MRHSPRPLLSPPVVFSPARVEEAREQTESAKGERNPTALAVKLESLCEFKCYSGELVESKEVSVDVLAS
ncbi:hypothetical protein ABZP36_035952 [Zizania latifolia]